ncbi:MAG: hypothetical protein AB1601_00475 [Planctomycetota bacterium]
MPRRRSSRLRAVVWLLVALTVLLVGIYANLTRPARLRAAVLAALRALPVAAEVGEVTFSPWEGLQISDLTLAPAAPSDATSREPLLRVGSAAIRCDVGQLLRGRLWPQAVEVRDAALRLESRRDAVDEVEEQSAAAEWRLIQRLLTATEGRLPSVTVWQGDVQLWAAEHGRAQLVQRLLVKAEGESNTEGYRLRVDRRPTGERALAELRWRRAAGELSVRFDGADLRTAAGLLPTRAAGFLRRFDLRGQAAVEQLVFRLGRAEESHDAGDPQALDRLWLAAVELRVTDGRLVLPVEEGRAAGAGPAADAFLRFTSVDATVAGERARPDDPGTVTLTADARLRGAATRLRAAASGRILERFQPATDRAADSEPGEWLDDLREAELQIDGLELPTLESFPAFVRSRKLGGPLAAAFEHYSPRGRVNVRLALAPSAAAAAELATRLEGEIEACGAACRYYLFPYDCVDMSGRVRLSRGRILLENLSGTHGGTRLWANGVVHSSHAWSGFDLTFHGRDVALDADLYGALPDEYRQLWQRAAPLGLCDVVASLRRADGSPELGALPTDAYVNAHLHAGSLALGAGGRLEQATGWITVHGGVVQVRGLHGRQGDAEINLDGTVRVVGDATHAELRLVVDNQPVDQRVLVGAGPAAVELRLTGHAAVWGRVWGTERGAGLNQQMTAELRDGRLAAADPRRPWIVTAGRVHVRDSRQEIEYLTCRQGEAEVNVSGVVTEAGAGGPGPVDLRLGARTPAVEELYPQFVPADWAALLDSFGLTGRGDVAVRLYPITHVDHGSAQAADVQVHAERMRPKPMPLDLRDVQATVTLAPGRFRLESARAQCGEAGRVTVRQAREGRWDHGSLEASFEVSAEGLRLEPSLVEALPGGLGRLLTRLAGQGQFDAYLPTVRARGAESRTWQFEGRVPLRGAALRVGLPLEVGQGELAGACFIGPTGEVELDARFSIGQGRLAGRPLANWDGRLSYRPDDRWVRIDDLHGQLCDGVAQGYLAIEPQTGEYELSAKLHDIGAAELFPPSRDRADRPRRGRVDGDVWLRGRGDDVGSRRGGGSLRLRGASFLQTPVLASVARQRAGRGGADHVDVAHLRFLWEGDLIRLRRIDIRSADLRMVGEGTWDLRSDAVEMTLWGARPEHWPRIAVLSDLLESAGQELVQYRVEGTLSAPKVTAEPLHRLSETLRGLLGEE